MNVIEFNGILHEVVRIVSNGNTSITGLHKEHLGNETSK